MGALKAESHTTGKKLTQRKAPKTAFKPGAEWRGNAAGRPKGSRHKLAADFVQALSDDFELHGAAAIQKAREDRPAQYITIVASLVPKEMDVTMSAGDAFVEMLKHISSQS